MKLCPVCCVPRLSRSVFAFLAFLNEFPTSLYVDALWVVSLSSTCLPLCDLRKTTSSACAMWWTCFGHTVATTRRPVDRLTSFLHQPCTALCVIVLTRYSRNFNATRRSVWRFERRRLSIVTWPLSKQIDSIQHTKPTWNHQW